MAKSGKEHLLKKVLFSKTLLVISLLIIVFMSMIVAKAMLRDKYINQEISNLEQQIAELEGKNSELDDFIEYFKSDFFLEHEARTKLNLKKQGEKVVVIKGDSVYVEDMENLDEVDLMLKKIKGNNVGRWWKYFFST